MNNNNYLGECCVDKDSGVFVLTFPFYNRSSKRIEKILNEIIFKHIKGENTFVHKKFGVDIVNYTVVCNEDDIIKLNEVCMKLNEKMSII